MLASITGQKTMTVAELQEILSQLPGNAELCIHLRVEDCDGYVSDDIKADGKITLEHPEPGFHHLLGGFKSPEGVEAWLKVHGNGRTAHDHGWRPAINLHLVEYNPNL